MPTRLVIVDGVACRDLSPVDFELSDCLKSIQVRIRGLFAFGSEKILLILNVKKSCMLVGLFEHF